jgi:hypothetical protein
MIGQFGRKNSGSNGHPTGNPYGPFDVTKRDGIVEQGIFEKRETGFHI